MFIFAARKGSLFDPLLKTSCEVSPGALQGFFAFGHGRCFFLPGRKS
jgi:hypothetical protein